MTFDAVEGGSDPATQTLQTSNGGSTLSWSVSDNATWLSLSPTSGTSTGETDNVTVSVSIGGLSAGNYTATITSTGTPPATGSPQTTSVTLHVEPPPVIFGPMSAAEAHTCGVTTGGTAYCWGYGVGGALGKGSTTKCSCRLWYPVGLASSR